MPGIEALVHRQLSADDTTQFHAELFWRGLATFEVAEDAVLMEGVEVLAGITEAYLLEPSDGILVTQGDDHTAKVERNVIDGGTH